MDLLIWTLLVPLLLKSYFLECTLQIEMLRCPYVLLPRLADKAIVKPLGPGALSLMWSLLANSTHTSMKCLCIHSLHSKIVFKFVCCHSTWPPAFCLFVIRFYRTSRYIYLLWHINMQSVMLLYRLLTFPNLWKNVMLFGFLLLQRFLLL